MDKNLQSVIHKYAEDREIDYMAAKVIGEQYGLSFSSEQDLIEWKQTIDRYLKTFEEKDFDAIEEMCTNKHKEGKKSKKKVKGDKLYYESKNPYDMDPEKVAELKKKAAEEGMTLEQYLKKRIDDIEKGNKSKSSSKKKQEKPME